MEYLPFRYRHDLVESSEIITKCLKDAIAGVIVESLKKQHETILSEINTDFNRTKYSCSHYCLDTLMPLHTHGLFGCHLQPKDWNYINAQGKIRHSMFYSVMFEKIVYQHRFKSPNWSTTDMTQWYTNIWEVAKCFIPEDERIDALKGQNRECIELLYVAINNVAVLGSSQHEVLELLTQIKEVQTLILNSPHMLDEIILNKYCHDVMVLLNTDWLRNRVEAVRAKHKIYQFSDFRKYSRWTIDSEESTQFENFEIALRRRALGDDDFRAMFIKTSTENKMMRKIMENVEKQQNKLEKEQNKFLKEQNTMKERQSEFCNHLHHLTMIFNEAYQNENRSMTDTDTEPSSKDKRTLKKISKRGAQDIDKDVEMPVISRPLDGRLITLDNKQIGALMKVCESKVLQGGFGVVYISKGKVPELDVHVVIKRITCEGHERIKKLSTLNEKIAARVLHFAIVPLIAYAEEQLEGGKRAYYFLSPYLEKRSLLGLIEKDTKCSNIHDVMLRCGNRIQILFQIASALDYLHTPVQGYRGIVLHMDVTTMNIVLDQRLNARLIDFGLAREMNEGQQKVSFTQSRSFGTPGYYPTIRYSSLTVHEDYYNFGVVTRELLTGRAPYIEYGNEIYELRKSSEAIIQKTLQKLIWTEPNKHALTLINLSTRCLKSRDVKQFTASSMVKELKNILNRNQWMRSEADKCDLCMVNVAVEDGKAPPHRCKIKICVSCMRNSHINPIRCPTCNEEVIPEIGHTFASLLIAGNDLENPALAKSFRREINEIKDVLASKYPCVIGISDENIKMVTPLNSGKREELLPQVSSAFDFFQERKNIGTLLIYFTGHHDSKRGFVLSCQNDVLPMAKLREFLMKLCKCWDNKARILVFLDCCEAPKMEVDPDLAKKGVKIIQINACRQTEFCSQSLSGSLFKTFFVQALTRKIFNKQCYRQGAFSASEEKCEDCKMSGDFISVKRLLEYISNHMKKCFSGNDPVLYMDDVLWPDAIIGYNVDFAVDLSFKFEEQSQKTTDVKLDQEMYCDINELKKHILKKVNCREDVKLKLTDKFADVISLRIHTGSEKGKELATMLQVNAAMNAKREIIASYRSVSHIVSGRVAMFTPTTCIYRYFGEKQMLKKKGGGRKVANLSFKDLDKVTDDIQGKPDLDTLHRFLLTVFETWGKETIKDDKELKVIFPCTKEKNGSEFVVLDLAEKAKGTFQCYDKLPKPFMPKQWIIMSLLVVLAAFILFIFFMNM